MPNIWHSTSKEINKRIKHAIEVRSSDRMHRKHITPLTLVFKDTHIEDKVRRGRRWYRQEITNYNRAHDVDFDLFWSVQFSQMRDEMFNSNLICSFIMLLFLMAVQALIPAPRWEDTEFLLLLLFSFFLWVYQIRKGHL